MQAIQPDIVAAIRQGDEQAYERLFRTYYESLCRYGYSVLKDMDEAEEIVQAVFLDLWEKRETTDIQISLKAYLYKMVYNRSLNRLKHEKVKDEYKQYNHAQINQNPAQAFHLAIENELSGRIEAAISGLPEQCQLIFRMSRFEELKYSEIAERLNLSVKTVENQMSKALRVLREKLAEYLEAP